MNTLYQEEPLNKAFNVKLSFTNDMDRLCERQPCTASDAMEVDCEQVGSNMCSYGSAAETIAAILSSKASDKSATDSIHQCNELEAQLQNEREMVKKLRIQLALCQQMLSRLRSAHSKCPITTTFEDLPDELIITIFSHLSTDCLIYTTRRVCRRWNYLSSDNILWSQMTPKSDLNTVVRAMNAAPCLRHASIPSEHLTPPPQFDEDDKNLQVLTTSECRVRSLELPDFQPISLRMMRNQMGYLRHLHLNSWWDHLRAAHREEVWRTLAELKLESLVLHEHDRGNSYFHSSYRPAAGDFAALRTLDLYCKVTPNALVADLLSACRGSLEVVSLPPKSDGETVQMLALCPRLREAYVPFLPQVGALEYNPRLDLIEINAEWQSQAEIQATIPDVVRFLHKPAVVARLRTLFFQGMPVGCSELLLAVGQVSGLRYVRIHNFGEPKAAMVVPDVLKRLPHLERFTLATMPPTAVLQRVSEALPSCPKLRELCLIGSCCDDDLGCRVPAVMRLLRNNTKLHVFLDWGLAVKNHLENAFPECLEHHRHVCEDESLWHRFYPVMVNHAPERCDWCRFKVEEYATVVDMRDRLDLVG